ncbi:MAG: 4Fe-4S binding protein, partial [Enterobacteriaceae bacterium]
MNRFVIADPQKCIGCRTCEVACVMAHSDPSSQTLTATSFTPRLRVLKGDYVSTAVMCRQCDDAPCLTVCPNGAIVRSKESIQVIASRCIGCKTCVVACPFGAIDVLVQPATTANGSLTAVAYKCDLCVDHSAGPSCVQVCPTDALRLI